MSFTELIQWKDAVFKRMLKDYKEFAVAVGVSRDRLLILATNTQAGISAAVDEGIPLTQVSVLKASKPVIGQGAITCGYRDNPYRPLKVGCSTSAVADNGQPVLGVPYTCSLGPIFQATDGEYYAVSANHCWAGTVCNISPTGKYAIQPSGACGGSYPDDYIGDVVSYTTPTGMVAGYTSYNADAALVRLSNPLFFDMDVLWDQDVYKPYTPRVIEPVIGMNIVKLGVGETTYSLRQGTITAYPASAVVMCPSGAEFVLEDQFIISAPTSEGDSGSAVLASDLSGIIGVTAAVTPEGYGIAGRFSNILKDFGLQLPTLPALQTATPSTIPSTIPTAAPSTTALAAVAAVLGAGALIGGLVWARRKKKGI
jgi:hypothetical protein